MTKEKILGRRRTPRMDILRARITRLWGPAAKGCKGRGRKIPLAGLCGLVLVLGGHAPSWAEIYKWQDDKGKWHFTDRPPPGTKTEEIQKGRSEGEAPSADLHSQLRDKFEPQTSIEEVTLAVVTIETPMSTGAGFFLSEDGHIVTNKHVVRPTGSPQWQAAVEYLEEQEGRF